MSKLANRIRCHSLFQEVQTNVAVESAMKVALDEMDRAYEADRRSRRSLSSVASIDDTSSDIDSFVSARDVGPLFYYIIITVY